MFVSAGIEVPLLADGSAAPSGVEGKWTCSMHPHVIVDSDGKCPECAMPLVQIPGEAKPAQEVLIPAIPVTAVLDSGTRKLVHVLAGPDTYKPVEVKLGPRAGDYFPVMGGLKEGDRVVIRGNFLLDSQFQIAGLPSLFYPEGQAPSAGHSGHRGMSSHGTGNAPASPPPAAKDAPPAGHKH
jgi:Cu(I)/Ag(I) efflux system membrane fusion protein